MQENGNHFGCGNCGNDNLLDDFERGTAVCDQCGCCAPLCHSHPRETVARRVESLYQAASGSAGTLTVSNRARAAMRMAGKPISAPYTHATYINERIAQWREKEPDIPEEDKDTIRRIAGPRKSITKDEIRAVLGECDKVVSTPRFVRKYLEKWLSIRHLLTGVQSRGARAPIALVHRLQWWFSRIVPLFLQNIKGHGRYSILNINFLFRRLFDLEDVWTHYSADFPPLKTDAKRYKLVMMWTDLCSRLGIPYVNNDQAVFPFVRFYSPASWTDNFFVNGGVYTKPKLRGTKRRHGDAGAKEEKHDSGAALRRLRRFYQYETADP